MTGRMSIDEEAMDESLEEKCRRIQLTTGIQDRAWKVLFGNECGLFGMFEQEVLKAKLEELRALYLVTVWSEDRSKIEQRIADLTKQLKDLDNSNNSNKETS